MSKKKGKAPNAKAQAWIDARKRHHLSHAEVQMARELGMNPKRLAASAGTARGLTPVPLSQHIEDLYLRRFRRTIPDPVVPLRQLRREAAARERAEARERRRKRRRAEIDHAEAARISLLTLWRLCNAVGLEGFSVPGGPATRDGDINGQEVK